MKKVFALFAIVGMFSFVACGPKAEEQAAETTEQVMEEAPVEAAVEAAPVEEMAPDSTAAATPAEGTAQ
jgi:hypothetical protein